MRKHLLGTFLFLFLFGSLSAQTLLSYQKLATFSVSQVDSMAASLGIPAILFQAQYGVDYYKITYLTPFQQTSNLVKASGGLIVPRSFPCDLPLAAYGHGTNSNAYSVASSMTGGQWEVCLLLSSTGYMTVLPDGLGMGDFDPSINVHPYMNEFSESYTTLNSMRCAREVADTLGLTVSGENFLFGYSQGGYTAAATQKLIEQNFSSEFTVTASVPMSGAYDLKDAQVDLILSDSVYPTPGYLPYLTFGYQEHYGNLYNSPSDLFKAPYDSILPPLFYARTNGIGFINTQCNPVPKKMFHDSIINAFSTDTTHWLRLLLLDNHLIDGWVPQSPTHLLYCDQDEQVSYLNSVNAYNGWSAAGAPNLSSMNMGSFSHGDCAFHAFLEGFNYFGSKKTACTPTGIEEEGGTFFRLYPNPADQDLRLIAEKSALREIRVVDIAGREMQNIRVKDQSRYDDWHLDISELAGGAYLLLVSDESGNQGALRFVKQ